MNLLLKKTSSIFQFSNSLINIPKEFHTYQILKAWQGKNNEPSSFINNNNKIYPPQTPDEPRRPAFVCHQKTLIKYSPWKMWYLAQMIRGMSIDEALKQLSFINKKGSAYVIETLLEAQEMAVAEHNVEFKSNLWVAESFTNKAKVIKGIRRHARARLGKVEYFYCHYFCRLEEGKPPKHYGFNNYQTGEERLDKWLEDLRKRKIINSL